MHWSELNLPVSMQGKSAELKKIFITAANNNFIKTQDISSALFAGTKAVSIAELKNAPKKVKAPKVPSHVQAIRDLSAGSFDLAKANDALDINPTRSITSANFNSDGQLILLFNDGHKIVTAQSGFKEYIEQHITVAPNTQIISSDDSILIDQENQVFDLITGPVINTLDHLDFKQATTSAGAVARLRWNDVDGTLEFGLKGGNVTLQIGQEQVVHILNNTTAAFTDLQVLRITGASGQRMTGALAQANGELNSASTFAVVTEPIAKNQTGFATINGLVRDVNTSAFNEGDILYLSPTVAGGITNIKPSAPSHLVQVGWCVRSNLNNGIIYVNVQNGYELEEIHNVKINGIANGHVLTWNSTTSLWENKPPTGTTSNTLTHFVKINTVANTAYVIEHNLGLVDKDAFTINTMLSGSQVQTSVSSIDTNSISVTTSVNTTDLAITIIGVKP